MTAPRGGWRRRRRARHRGADEPRDIGEVLDIPVTPLIDVMMCLLVIFMIITPVITYYGARVPKAVHPQRASIDDAVSIGVRRDGTLFVGEDTVTFAELPARLRELYDTRPGDHLLYLWADADVPFDRVQDVVESARQAGVRAIGAIVAPVETEATSARRPTGSNR